MNLLCPLKVWTSLEIICKKHKFIVQIFFSRSGFPSGYLDMTMNVIHSLGQGYKADSEKQKAVFLVMSQ